MTDDRIGERLARIDERLKALNDMLETRVTVVERRLETEIAEQQIKHGKLQDDVDSSWTAIRDLQWWRQRVIGMGMMVGAGSGVVSGVLVALFSGTLGFG